MRFCEARVQRLVDRSAASAARVVTLWTASSRTCALLPVAEASAVHQNESGRSEDGNAREERKGSNPEQASPRGGEQEEPDDDLTPPVRRIGGVGDLRESVDTFNL